MNNKNTNYADTIKKLENEISILRTTDAGSLRTEYNKLAMQYTLLLKAYLRTEEGFKKFINRDTEMRCFTNISFDNILNEIYKDIKLK